MSMPILSAMIFISFTRPIFTARWMFSKSFAISATRVELTGTTWSIAWLYRATPTSRQAGVEPPTILGIFFVENFSLPGSSRSGENTTKKSSPVLRPFTSVRARTSSSVVPG
jgi:hypothetical protein